MINPLYPREETIYARLCAMAEIGEKFPTMDAFGKSVNMSGTTVRTSIKLLERLGYITIHRPQKSSTSVITIKATGKATKDPTAGYTNTHGQSYEQMMRRKEQMRINGDAERMDLEKRIAEDQARIENRKLELLKMEQMKYGLPKRGRLLSSMVA